MRTGFSLVELSIVLVILGLLTGGILTGQNLIRAAELRSITTQFQTYQTAAHTFRDKYFAIPGDMANATDFWGTAAACPGAAADARTDSSTCNGDGNGQINRSATNSNEKYGFWQHLANAGLIEGSFAGVTNHASIGANRDSVTNFNVPAGKIGNTGWDVEYTGLVTIADTSRIEGEYGNELTFGTKGSTIMANEALTPEEAWNIDTKIDDSIAGSGALVARESLTDCFLLADNSAGSSSGTNARNDVIYNLTDSAIRCSLFFKDVF